MTAPLTSIRTSGDSIEIVDQLLLPHTTSWIPITSPEEAHGAIKRMQIRGAPAIASLASLSVASHISAALALGEPPAWLESVDTLRAHVRPILDHLYTARPTAVNLGVAVKRLKGVLDSQEADVQALARALVAEARAVADEDVGRNMAMSAHGADWLLRRVKEREGKARKLRVLTVCNTGSLATSGYGTALGVITRLFETGNLERAYYTQSAPYHQGTRLTSYELLQLGAPSCMVVDTMVGSLFQHHQIDAVLVGADRVARNGDTANKVGTYNAAVLAQRHGVPLLVVAPISTLDLSIKDGSEIPIEHRPPLEACTARGALLPRTADGAQATVLISPILSAIASSVPGDHKLLDPTPSTPSQGAEKRGPIGGEGEAPTELQQVYNPSFDVTPAELIAAIVTEKGVAERPESGSYDLTTSGVV